MISVITINYNDKKGLEKTIKSVIDQTSPDYEFIVIDGGSTDGSVEVIKKNADKITYWVSERDGGIYNAMNKGVDVANGEYCIFMNSGDCFYDNNVLSNSIPYLTGTDIVYGAAKSANSEIIYYNKAYPDLHFFYNGTLTHQSTFIKRSLLLKYKYDENLKIVSDFKFFLQVFIKDNCSFKRLDSIICIYDESGISSTNKELLEQEKTQVIHEMFPRIINTFEEFYTDSWERKLYNEISNSKYHGCIYTINVVILKMLSLFIKGAYWIKKYPFRLK